MSSGTNQNIRPQLRESPPLTPQSASTVALQHDSKNILPTVPSHQYSPNREPFDRGFPDLPPIIDSSLKALPFAHRATAGQQHISGVDGSYERLEFLGDAYIEIIAARLLYQKFPKLTAGRLSQVRELLVKNETLAEFALAYKFDERAEIPLSHKDGHGDRQKLWIKTMGDMFEAYVAAIINSDPRHGFGIAEEWLTRLWTPKLSSGENHEPPLNTTAKQDLSQKIMSKGVKVDYRDEGRTDIKKEGKSWFKVGAYFTGWHWENQHLGSGTGLNKSEAGARAAMEALRNPLTARIGAVKREYDVRIRVERGQESLEKQYKGAERPSETELKKDQVDGDFTSIPMEVSEGTPAVFLCPRDMFTWFTAHGNWNLNAIEKRTGATITVADRLPNVNGEHTFNLIGSEAEKKRGLDLLNKTVEIQRKEKTWQQGERGMGKVRGKPHTKVLHPTGTKTR